jgi:transcriptional regulator with XRE-family HTH domain
MTQTLRELRRAKGLSIIAVAGPARVSPTSIGLAERGRLLLSEEQARRVADALGVRVEDIEELAAAAVEGIR